MFGGIPLSILFHGYTDYYGNFLDRKTGVLWVIRNVYDLAYRNRNDITGVIFGEGVTSVGESAFSGCLGITSIHLPEGLLSIGRLAFSGCSRIIYLRLPGTLKYICSYAFCGCRGITSFHLPEGLISIGSGAFLDCSGIISLHLPKTLDNIGSYAFQGCSGIGGSLQVPASVKVVGDSAFRGLSIVELLIFPTLDLGIGNNLYRWGSFKGCTKLVRVIAPDGLIQGDNADLTKVFEDCPVLAGTGMTPHSTVPLLRRTFWHPTTHTWCTTSQRACVLALLVAELRSDRQVEETALLPLLVHDLWLLILQFVPRHGFGRC